MNYLPFVFPVVAAVVGWIIHKLAVSYILTNYWLNKQHQLSKSAANWIASRFTLTDLEQKIADPTVLNNAMPAIEKHIDTFLNEKLQQEIPMLSMFVGTKTTDKIKEIFIAQLRELFPTVMSRITGNLKENFDIEKKISEKLSEPSAQQSIQSQLRSQLKPLPVLGLLSGFLIGTICALLFLLFG